jgi:hypothetical protein
MGYRPDGWGLTFGPTLPPIQLVLSAISFICHNGIVLNSESTEISFPFLMSALNCFHMSISLLIIFRN